MVLIILQMPLQLAEFVLQEKLDLKVCAKKNKLTFVASVQTLVCSTRQSFM